MNNKFSGWPVCDVGDGSVVAIAIAAAEQGARVTVDLIKHSLDIDGAHLIDDGQWAGSLGIDRIDETMALAMIEHAFAAFERSVPEHSARDHSRWFHSCSDDELADSELVTGQERPVAKARLEVTTLGLILNGSLTCQSQQMQGKWFWQSPNHPHLVILADWLKF